MPLLVNKPSKIDLEGKQNYNLIRYQMARTLEAEDVYQKAEEVRKLKDVVAINDANVRAVKFPNEQSDASEFVTPLFEALCLEKPLLTVSKTTPRDNAGNYIEKESKGEEQVSVALEVKGNDGKIVGSKVSELLQRYNKVEELSSDVFFQSSDGTSKKVKTNKELNSFVKKGATEIVVSLKRFDNFGNKIKDNVVLDNFELPVVDLETIEKKEDAQNVTYDGAIDPTKCSKAKFEPTAFIYHQGSSPNSGHYFTFVKEKDNKWYCYNDSVRSVVEGAELENYMQNAYIVKYSTAGKDGKVALPEAQRATKNPSNACWINASTVFAGAFTSFEHCKTATLNDDERVKFSKAVGSQVSAAKTAKVKHETKPVISVTKKSPEHLVKETIFEMPKSKGSVVANDEEVFYEKPKKPEVKKMVIGSAENENSVKKGANVDFLSVAREDIKMFQSQMLSIFQSDKDIVGSSDAKIILDFVADFDDGCKHLLNKNPSISEKQLKKEVKDRMENFFQKVDNNVKDQNVREAFDATRKVYKMIEGISELQEEKKVKPRSYENERSYLTADFSEDKKAVLKRLKSLGFDENGVKVYDKKSEKVVDVQVQEPKVKKTVENQKKPSTSPRVRSPEVQKTIQRLIDLGFDEKGNKVR